LAENEIKNNIFNKLTDLNTANFRVFEKFNEFLG